MKYLWASKIRNIWSILCKRQVVIDSARQIRAVLTNTTKVSICEDSAGGFSQPQRLIDFSCSPQQTCGSLTFHVRAVQACLGWSQALLQWVLPCIDALTEPKPSSPMDTRLAYVVLIPDRLFLKLHNSSPALRPLFISWDWRISIQSIVVTV